MFLRMLKKDLMSKKGLNIILFIFIMISAVLVFISSTIIFIGITGPSDSKKLYKSSDAAIILNSPLNEKERLNNLIMKSMDENENVRSYYKTEILSIKDYEVDITDFCKNKSAESLNVNFCFSRLPVKSNLVYDLDDKPFYVKNGEIALSARFKDELGAKIGDKLRISDELGYVYEFTISHFYKDYDEIFIRMIVSDQNYDTLKTRYFSIIDTYYLSFSEHEGFNMYSWVSDMSEKADYPIAIYYIDNDFSSHTVIVQLISFFMTLLSGFMIILIFLTIRFTVITELKEQEKEIGIMRAVGVDSLKFRWLFSAKYIAFAVVGGTIGIAVGYPFTMLFCKQIYKYLPMPSKIAMMSVGIIAVVSIILFIILFSLFTMRKMKAISIMTAIHGETLGERYSPGYTPKLHKNKLLPIPLYLAVSDIMSNFKRYIFLVMTYTLCVSIMLLTVYLRFSVISPNFYKYAFNNQIDFDIEFSALTDDMQDIISERAIYENHSLPQQINEIIREQNIPAHYELYLIDDTYLKTTEGRVSDAMIYYYMNECDKLQYHEGKAPVLPNEVCISYYSAKQMNLSLGSVIEIDIPSEYDYRDQMRTEQFVITGFFDVMEAGIPIVIVSPEFDPFENEEYRDSYSSVVIDSDDKDKVISQLEKYFGKDSVMTEKQYLYSFMAEFIPVLNLMMYSCCSAVIIISILITILYLNIFLAEAKQDISLLINLGFRERTIKNWQLLKILILGGISVFLGVATASTIGLKITRIATEKIVYLTGFKFVHMPLFTFLAVPMIFSTIILIPSLIILRKIRNTDLRSIKEEM